MAKSKLARVPLKDLEREIERRRAELPKLIAQRDELSRRIAELEGVGAAPPPAKKAKRAVRKRRRKPPEGRFTLNDALAQVLAGKKAVSIPEAADGVLATGYTSRSKNLRRLVYQTLYHGDQFKKVGRGLFALK